MRRLARKKKGSRYFEISNADLKYLRETAKKYLFSFDTNKVSKEEAAFIIASLKMREVKNMEKPLKDYTKIIVETDDEKPVIIAEIKADNVKFADGYRVRLIPKYN